MKTHQRLLQVQKDESQERRKKINFLAQNVVLGFLARLLLHPTYPIKTYLPVLPLRF